jgi:hypothetical protein
LKGSSYCVRISRAVRTYHMGTSYIKHKSYKAKSEARIRAEYNAASAHRGPGIGNNIWGSCECGISLLPDSETIPLMKMETVENSLTENCKITYFGY